MTMEMTRRARTHGGRERAPALRILLLIALVSGAGAARALAAARTYDPVNASPAAAASDATVAVRFAVIGDWGSGDERERAVGEQIAAAHDRARIDMVVTTGDNIYPNGSASMFARKFEGPFAPVLARSIPFYASLGNHDVRSGEKAQLAYPLFHMEGNRYYRFRAGGNMAEFFILDSNRMDDEQLAWLDERLGASEALWKVVVFHHPIYSSGRLHGSNKGLRKRIEPILVRRRVDVVLSGHDHIYERVRPQQGIQYFVTGAGGELRKNGVDTKDPLAAASYDKDCHFMLFEATPARLEFEAISSKGEVVDRGAIERPAEEAAHAARASRGGAAQ